MTVFVLTDAAGLIVNRIIADPSFSASDGLLLVQEVAGSPYEIGGSIVSGIYTPPVQQTNPVPPPPPSVLSQDLMAQFTADDAAKIQTAIAGNVQFWLLWQSLTTQKDPMLVTNARFLAGWSALVQVLGQPRMDAIAVALNVTIG